MRGMQGTLGMFTRIPGNLLEDSGECYYFNISGNVPEDSGECSKRFRAMFKKIPGNAQADFRESKFRFILWNLAYFLSNSAIKLWKNKGIFSVLLITNYNQSLTVKYCFTSTFFLTLFFLLPRKGCNYCAQVQGYQKALNNPLLRGFKNTLHGVGPINLKLDN